MFPKIFDSAYFEPIKTLNKDYDNLFWWPVCPVRFVALGMVANKVYPSPGEFYCVNADLADISTEGEWENQWSRSEHFFKFGYKVNTDLWETYQKLPFFSIGLRGDERLGNPKVRLR